MAVTLSVGFSSCKKCLECKGKNAAGGDVKQEVCGNKDERTKGETAFKQTHTDSKCE